MWGRGDTDEFYSGGGSREPQLVEPYVKTLRRFLSELEQPTVLDLGCGDFFIGKELVDLAGSYVAADVARNVVELNKKRYKSQNLSFVHLDATRDPLPETQVVIVRQVLQHLSNDAISTILGKLQTNFRYMVLTEGVPSRKNYRPNVDIPTGHLVRANISSGVDVEKPPFNLEFISREVLLDIPWSGGRLKTTLYTFS